MQPLTYEIVDESSFQLALAQVRQAIKRFGYDDVQSAKLLTITSELARNILKYAGNGSLQLGLKSNGDKSGLEIMALDKGPGIENVEKAMSDNFSSSGTLGQGLPGARRLADEFSIDSQLGKGTKVRAILWL